jgi:hypothetical protein
MSRSTSSKAKKSSASGIAKEIHGTSSARQAVKNSTNRSLPRLYGSALGDFALQHFAFGGMDSLDDLLPLQRVPFRDIPFEVTVDRPPVDSK